MHLKLQQIGNSVGVILPKEELTKRGLHVGDSIAVTLEDDPFWADLSRYTKEQRRAIDKQENLIDDDFNEWKDI